MKYISLIFLFLILYVTNPTRQDFSYFIRYETQERLKLEGSNANVLISEFISAAAIEATHQKNYFFASKYTIDTSSLRIFAPNLPFKIEFFGIAGTFIPLSQLP